MNLIKIAVKVDRNPPKGSVAADFFFNGPLLFTINHYDLPSLFAGKLHALLFRKYAKGRDYYDLLFYLRKKTPFNLELFRNAARQTEPALEFNDVPGVLDRLERTILSMDHKRIRNDIAPFLLDPDELRFVGPEFLSMALRQNIEAGVYR